MAAPKNTQPSPAVATPTDTLRAELEALRAENARLKEAKARNIGVKISEKGAVSLYGVGRFPVTLYRNQWLALLDYAPSIQQFIDGHKAELDAVEARHAADKAQAKQEKADKPAVEAAQRASGFQTVTDKFGRTVVTPNTSTPNGRTPTIGEV
jgi:cell division protein FtsB